MTTNVPLDPNDPKIFNDPDKVASLDPRAQLIAFINLAKTGQIVNGDHMLTLELILKEAGYDIDVNGEISREEELALKHFVERLSDKQMINAMNALVEDITRSVPLPKAETLSAQNEWTRSVLSSFVKANRGFLTNKLISDPD